jgi:predicted nucleic acid-binding protein
MVGTHALFDTNILIDFTLGIPAAQKEMKRYRNRAISIITWMEVMAGIDPAQEVTARAFLATFLIYPITPEISEQAVVFRKTLRIKLPDAIILATAEIEDLLLITRNTKDFPQHLPRIRVPYKI